MSGLAIGLSIGFALAGGAAGFAAEIAAGVGGLFMGIAGAIGGDRNFGKSRTPRPIRSAFVGAACGAALGYGVGWGIDGGVSTIWNATVGRGNTAALCDNEKQKYGNVEVRHNTDGSVSCIISSGPALK